MTSGSIKEKEDVMFITKEKPHMYFDVDSTLVRPAKDAEEWLKLNEDQFVFIENTAMVINTKVIKDLKMCKVRGHTVVVWSQGGSSWAETVVKALDLVDYVDVVMAKPSWYVDDRKWDDILDKSRWYDGNF